MIKVFTTGKDPGSAGDELTRQFEEWKNSFAREIEVLSINSNSNKYGWMLIVNYKMF
jgi:hypothetical protein